VSDLEAPVRLALASLSHLQTEEQKPFALLSLGATLYRAGRFDEAIKRLEESIRAGHGQGLPHDWVFLAMAHHRLGHHDEAIRWLERLETYEPVTGLDFSLEDGAVEILRREAVSLILGKGKPPEPPR
jgi:tetratricopeptide (TPR) repeat protein